MKIATIEQVMKNAGRGEWEEYLQIDRAQKLKIYKYSLILESSFLEIDMSEKWLQENVGKNLILGTFIFITRNPTTMVTSRYFLIKKDR